MTTIAAPMAKCKDYCFHQWEAATRQHKRVLAVSDGWEGDYPSLSIHSYDNGYFWFTSAWRKLYEVIDDELIVSLETDVIPADGDWLEQLEAEYTGGFLRHGVPWRASLNRSTKGYEMGCTMFTRDILREALKFSEESGMALYTVVGNPYFFPHKDIDVLKVEHLDYLD